MNGVWNGSSKIEFGLVVRELTLVRGQIYTPEIDIRLLGTNRVTPI